MLVQELIARKRDGGELTPSEMNFLLDGYLKGTTADYHMASWLMAVFFQGLSARERDTLTHAMWHSGQSLTRHHRSDFWIDKHSTGGVGDKPSILLVPIVTAAARAIWGKGKVKIPMVSGRGLGFSGGTLDKLDAIPGFRTRLSLDEGYALLEKNGYFMMGQTDEMAPLDRMLYSLRDVTATVESEPLIVASIMSKKLAESLDGLVLDVKWGRGAFMPTRRAARSLAQSLLATARHARVEAVALVTDMNRPLGRTVGNFIEVEECLEFLQGVSVDAEQRTLVLVLAQWMLHLASRKQLSLETCAQVCEEALASGRAFDCFQELVESHGGDWKAFRLLTTTWRQDREAVPWLAPASGTLLRWDPKTIALYLTEAGGGRMRKEDAIDPFVGIEFHRKVGERVRAGEKVATLYLRERVEIGPVLGGALEIGEGEAAASGAVEVLRN